jgi:hypothetical protein
VGGWRSATSGRSASVQNRVLGREALLPQIRSDGSRWVWFRAMRRRCRLLRILLGGQVAEHRPPQLDDIAVLEGCGGAQPAAVSPRGVRAAEILQPVSIASAHQSGVMPGDGSVAERHSAARVPSQLEVCSSQREGRWSIRASDADQLGRSRSRARSLIANPGLEKRQGSGCHSLGLPAQTHRRGKLDRLAGKEKPAHARAKRPAPDLELSEGT